MDYSSSHFALLWTGGMVVLYAVVIYVIPARFSHHGVTVFIRRAFPIVILAGLYPFARQLFLKGLP